ncbi:MAG: hypothetical protein JXR12_06175 [Neptunomonas phycophila]|uniref:hypothetical protein n=1 Tax=Neptunomonas phycophila TaxID=1572645 RepID=UPI003B8CBC38
MQRNMIRVSESLTEDVLEADGWKFAGLNLYSRPDRNRGASANRETAMRDTLNRHITDGGDTWLQFYGENPTDEQLMEMLHQLNLILDPQVKISMMETTLAKIQAAVEESDGRIEEVFDFIKSEIGTVSQAMLLDEERRSMRSDFSY